MSTRQAKRMVMQPGCPGPLVWFDVEPAEPWWRSAAVLECGACGYIVTTGNYLDDRHRMTPVLRSPA